MCFWCLCCGASGAAPPPEFFAIMQENLIVIRAKVETGEGEPITQIPEEEANCEICYSLLDENNSVLMTICECKPSLTHEHCELGNPNKRKEDKTCDVCGKVIQHIAVTLSQLRTETLENPISSPKRSGSRFSRFFRCKRKGRTSG